MYYYNFAILEMELIMDEQKLKLYKESPIDSDGAERVKALPKFGKDETWTICYILLVLI